MKDYKFSIDAGGSKPRTVKGRFIKVKEASIELEIQAFNDEGRQVANLLLSQGGDVTLTETFETVRVKNPSGSSTTATLIIGLGNSKDNQLSGEVSIAQGQTLTAAAHTLSTSASEILAASSARRSVIVQNVDGAIDVFVGGSGVTAADGMKIAAGQSLTLDNSAAAAVYAVAASGTPEVRTLSEAD